MILTIIVVILLMPITIVPYIHLPYKAPKDFLIFFLAAVLLCASVDKIKAIRGWRVLLVLVALNIFSLLHTANIYYTKHAFALNVSCLAIYYYLAAFSTPKWNERLLIAVAITGIPTSIIAILQAYDVWLIMPDTHSSPPAWIGNSNYVGAFLIFPFYAALWLIFSGKRYGKWFVINLLPIMIALVFCRARAAWVGIVVTLPLFVWMIRRNREN